jgi:hypothetical protein
MLAPGFAGGPPETGPGSAIAWDRCSQHTENFHLKFLDVAEKTVLPTPRMPALTDSTASTV